MFCVHSSMKERLFAEYLEFKISQAVVDYTVNILYILIKPLIPIRLYGMTSFL